MQCVAVCLSFIFSLHNIFFVTLTDVDVWSLDFFLIKTGRESPDLCAGYFVNLTNLVWVLADFEWRVAAAGPCGCLRLLHARAPDRNGFWEYSFFFLSYLGAHRPSWRFSSSFIAFFSFSTAVYCVLKPALHSKDVTGMWVLFEIFSCGATSSFWPGCPVDPFGPVDRNDEAGRMLTGYFAVASVWAGYVGIIFCNKTPFLCCSSVPSQRSSNLKRLLCKNLNAASRWVSADNMECTVCDQGSPNLSSWCCLFYNYY